MWSIELQKYSVTQNKIYFLNQNTTNRKTWALLNIFSNSFAFIQTLLILTNSKETKKLSYKYFDLCTFFSCSTKSDVYLEWRCRIYIYAKLDTLEHKNFLLPTSILSSTTFRKAFIGGGLCPHFLRPSLCKIACAKIDICQHMFCYVLLYLYYNSSNIFFSTMGNSRVTAPSLGIYGCGYRCWCCYILLILPEYSWNTLFRYCKQRTNKQI